VDRAHGRLSAVARLGEPGKIVLAGDECRRFVHPIEIKGLIDVVRCPPIPKGAGRSRADRVAVPLGLAIADRPKFVGNGSAFGHQYVVRETGIESSGDSIFGRADLSRNGKRGGLGERVNPRIRSACSLDMHFLAEYFGNRLFNRPLSGSQLDVALPTGDF